MSAEEQAGSYPCPYCKEGPLETVATATYVRGYLLHYTIGSKSFTGCVPCVRSKILGETVLSCLLGWFSLRALIINPFLIVCNVFRSVFVKPNHAAVANKLRDLGLPAPDLIKIQAVGALLTASMILADGEIDEAEIRAAEKAGDEVFGEFDEAGLRMILQQASQLPPAEDLAGMLKDVLDKAKVMVYLSEIAMADGNVSPEERAMLERVSEALQIEG
jgi:uncharacterized tellurite resistance protein B-like protein